MDAEITFRRALPSDAGTLAEMRVLSSAERRKPIDAAEREAFRAACEVSLEAAMRDGIVLGWLAYDGERAVGTATLMLLPTLPRLGSRGGERDGRVRNVYVDPAYRRRGIARQLMRVLLEDARQARVDRLALGASDMGRGLYEQLGFVIKDDEMTYEGNLT